VDPKDCPDNDRHNVDAIDALMIVPPVVMASLKESREKRIEMVRAAIQTTRNTQAVLPFAEIYADMLVELLQGADLRRCSIV
jgi:hypothetical protein